MHKVTVESTITVGSTPIVSGKPHLMSNVLTGELLRSDSMVNGKPFYAMVRAEPFENIYPSGSPTQRIWIIRTGGFGDLLMLTPAIQALLERGNEVIVACDQRYQCVFEGFTHPNFKVLNDPIPAANVKEGDAVVCMEGVIEGSEEARRIHAVELFAKILDAPIITLHLHYSVLPSEEEWAKASLPKEKTRVGIQCKASSPVRSYNENYLAVVIELLLKNGYEVVLFGAPGDIACDIPGVVNLSNANLTFRQSCALVATCDAFIAPDSSLAHIAQALHIPLVALFASFPSNLRLTGIRAITVAIDAKSECGPCFHHSGSTDGGKWPIEGPCRQAKFCTSLASISSPRIVDAVVNLLGGV